MINISDKKDCCGCTGCASTCPSKAITMEVDNEGFSYPIANPEKCTHCNLCEKVCPIIFRDTHDIKDKPKAVYALHNKNNQIWQESSSGGVFDSLVKYCLNMGGIVYGAEYNDDFVVVHRGERDAEGALKFRGSKYVQSDLTGIYVEIRKELRKGNLVLFSGVPCQVEGLKQFLLKPYENLITVDLLCHGVPSPKVFADYIKYIRNHTILPLKKINMKDKTFGWGYQNVRLYYCTNISEFNTPVSNLWNKLFYDHVINRPSCHKCRFKNQNRAGDISIGDFWGIEKYHPHLKSEKGVSLILINSAYGLNIWESIREQFNYKESKISECLQPALDHSYPDASDRVDFWNKYPKNGFYKMIKKRYNISVLNLIKRNFVILSRKLF